MEHELRRYVLPPKVTGFYDPKDEPPPHTDMAKFKTVCEKIGLSPEFRIIGYVDLSKERLRSYSFAVFKDLRDEKHYRIFCNLYYPIIGYAEIPSIYAYNDAMYAIPEHKFVDMPDFDKYFDDYFIILPKEVLSLHLTAEDPNVRELVRNLQNEEFAQFSHYRPNSLGDVVYNCWND